MTVFTVDIVIALEASEQPTQRWWTQRYRLGAIRAGGIPPEIRHPLRARRKPETDPETGDRFARVTLPLPTGTALGRARELAHMLTSVLAAEGYTLRKNGEHVDTIPGDSDGLPAGLLGGPDFREGRVCSEGCMACVLSTDTRLGCCGQGAAFSLADLGAALIDGDDEFVAQCLGLPGQPDGVKWHPHLVGGSCVYHNKTTGCTLKPARMPLQCRTYLCSPERLLPPVLVAEYTAYAEALEEAEAFVEDHMLEAGLTLTSPLEAIKAAATQAFAARNAESKPKPG